MKNNSIKLLAGGITGMFGAGAILLQTSHDIFGMILIIIGVIVSTAGGFAEYFRERQTTKNLTPPEDTYNSDITNHVFFQRMNNYILFDIKGLVLENQAKRNMIVVFLTARFLLFYILLKRFVEKFKEDENIMTSETMMSLLSRAYGMSDTIALECGVLPEFINQFNTFHQGCTDSLVTLCEIVFHNLFLKTPLTKLRTILDILLFVFTDTLCSTIRTIDAMNGGIEKTLNDGRHVITDIESVQIKVRDIAYNFQII